MAKLTLPVGGLNGSPYSVLAFLGNLEKDATNWLSEGNYTGTVATLGGMKLPEGLTVTTSIDITEALKKKVSSGELKGTSEDEVVAFVKEHLNVRVLVGDMEVKKEELQGEIKVELVSTVVEEAEDGGFEKWVGGLKEYGIVQ